MRRTFVPGRDRTGTIAELKKALVNLTSAIGQAESPAVAEALVRQMNAHAEAVKRLEAEPVVRPRWIEEPTGATFRQRWLAVEEWGSRAELLVRAGVRFFCEGSHKTGAVHVFLPEHLREPEEGASNGAGEAEGQDGHESGARRFLSELRRSKGMDPLLWDYRR